MNPFRPVILINRSDCGDRRGFTLIELLVSLAVIAVLLVFILSGLGQMRARSNAVKCVSNLRQNGAMLLSFAGENNGIIPFHSWDYTADPSSVRWGDCLVRAGYTDRFNPAFSCPHDPPRYQELGFGYGGIAWTDGNDPHSSTINGNPTSRAIRLMTIQEPSKYWLLADSWSRDDNAQIYLIDRNTSNGWLMSLRHNGRANMLFADGHVEAVDLHRTRDLPIHPINHAYTEDKKVKSL